ncbi:MAG TPA: glutamyl-tRNA reductase [Chloroflexota bacterium]|nr:glutamyl-tRNA reductase [Chloroflexota bacterium]
MPAIVQVGIDHTIAPLAVRERFALGGDAAALVLQRLVAEPAIAEAAILSTCNRVELYAAAGAPEAALCAMRRAFADTLAAPVADLDGLLVTRHGLEAVRHLCAVASGLQSMVVAEGQILGQVQAAQAQAQRLGTAGPHLGAAFRAAIACGKRVRTETPLGRTDFSVSSVLIDLLTKEIADWPAQRVLLIGAGRMTQLTAERLRALGAGSITVTSRTFAAAERLAHEVGGEARTLADAPALARQATLIVCATRSPGLMLTASMLEGRPAAPLLIVDLAVPRDVDPAAGALPAVRLLDIDDLRGMQDRHGLADALDLAERMVVQAGADWQVWCRTREAVPLIADLRAHVDRQKEAELARTLSRLEHLPEAERAEVQELAHRLVNKMFHHLAVRMKQAAADPELGAQYLETARYLFQRDDSPVPQPPHTEGTARAAPAPAGGQA